MHLFYFHIEFLPEDSIISVMIRTCLYEYSFIDFLGRGGKVFKNTFFFDVHFCQGIIIIPNISSFLAGEGYQKYQKLKKKEAAIDGEFLVYFHSSFIDLAHLFFRFHLFSFTSFFSRYSFYLILSSSSLSVPHIFLFPLLFASFFIHLFLFPLFLLPYSHIFPLHPFLMFFSFLCHFHLFSFTSFPYSFYLILYFNYLVIINLN